MLRNLAFDILGVYGLPLQNLLATRKTAMTVLEGDLPPSDRTGLSHGTWTPLAPFRHGPHRHHPSSPC